MSLYPRRNFESEPKEFGFRILVPNPHSLFHFARSTAIESGDRPADYKLNRPIEEWFDNCREWQVEWWLDRHQILSMITVELEAAYSPLSGEWASARSIIEFTDVARDVQWDYKPASEAKKIQLYLEQYGFKVIHTHSKREESHVNRLQINNLQGDKSMFYLGYENEEIALIDDPEGVAEYGNGALFVITDNLDIGNETRFARQLTHFASASSYAVDAIYHVFDKTPPNVALELT